MESGQLDGRPQDAEFQAALNFVSLQEQSFSLLGAVPFPGFRAYNKH